MDDKQLMAQIAAGDQAALQTLLRRHGPLLQYILKPILTDPREREECLADISPAPVAAGRGLCAGAGGRLCRG